MHLLSTSSIKPSSQLSCSQSHFYR